MTVIPPVFNTLTPVFKSNSMFSKRFPFDLFTMNTPIAENPEWCDYVQIYYTISGSYFHTVNGEKKERLPGSATLIFPFTSHLFDTSETSCPDTCIIKLSFIKYPDKFIPLTYKEASFNSFSLSNFIEFEGREKEIADNIFMNISSEYSKKQNMSNEKIMKYVSDFFTLCAKKECASLSKYRLKMRKTQNLNAVKASEYIDEHCKRNISIDEVCNFLDVPRRSFTSQFKAVTNQTFNQYYTFVRANRAFRALRYSTKSVEEIAEEFGYSTPTRFILACKEVFGKTPLAMKKSMIEHNRLYGEILNKIDFERHIWKDIWGEDDLFEHHAHAVANYQSR